MCIIVHCDLLSVANTMMIYSHNVSLAEWASIYKSYYTNAMRACNGGARRRRRPPPAARRRAVTISCARRRRLALASPSRSHRPLPPSCRLFHLADAGGGGPALAARRRPVRCRAEAARRSRRRRRGRSDPAHRDPGHAPRPPLGREAARLPGVGAHDGRREGGRHLGRPLRRRPPRREALHRHVARRRAQGQAGDRDAAHDGQQGLPPRRARARLVGPLV